MQQQQPRRQHHDSSRATACLELAPDVGLREGGVQEAGGACMHRLMRISRGHRRDCIGVDDAPLPAGKMLKHCALVKHSISAHAGQWDQVIQERQDRRDVERERERESPYQCSRFDETLTMLETDEMAARQKQTRAPCMAVAAQGLAHMYMQELAIVNLGPKSWLAGLGWGSIAID